MATGKNKTAATDTSDSEENGRKYRAPALEKGLDILELLASQGGSLTTSQMATSLGRSVSELFRMVLALEYRGYIAPAEGREGYELTNKLFALGMAQTANRTLLDAALPVMNDLSRAIGQSCHLVVPTGDQVVVVARIESPRDLGFAVRIGYRRPMVDAASGLMLFGYQPETEKGVWLERLASSSEPERLERFVAESKAAVEQGYVRTPSKFVDGVTDLCVPVLGAQGAVAALIVPFIISKPLPATAEEVIEKLHDASARIASQLNGE
ncbi:IclR family transcriptional regulator [Marinimicrobium sp. ABcell2]|uniref:IclR family transcriptional regulator n=1 Tax=Marinimicrobium sp. ABcell2 TaxID=3069751 RepID=UPI0027B544D2|nr:IclR family transcriptional regulator [Marinimicrobium sp. ABcell2]MDQ2077219.1 IclR family transcriptional regulator [Marinimicrobium sp. ABcell2]